MGGAAESILQDILTQANITNLHLVKLLKDSAASGGTGSPAAAPAKEASKAMGLLSTSAYAVGAAFGFVKKAADSVATAYINNVASIYGFSKAASLGEAKLGEFYAAFAQTPIIGKFFGLMGDMYSYQETILESWKSLSNVGATLGGSLTEVRNLAQASGMSLSEFTTFVGQNSQTLSLFGSSVSSGTKKFVAAQAETRESMMALGYTSKESADVLALFTRSQGAMSKQAMVSSLTQTEAAISFAKELKIASDLTGQNNEELRKQVEAAQADNAWQVYLSTITDDKERQKLINALNFQTAQNGEAGAKMFKEMAVTGTLQTESSAAFAAATQNQAVIANQQVLAMIRNGASEDEVRLAYIKNQVRVVDSTKGLAVGLQGAYYSMQSNNDSMATVANTTLKNGTAFNDRYTKMTDQQIKDEGRKLDLSKSNAVDLQKQQNALRNFATGFVNSIFAVIAPIVAPLQAFADGILKIAAKILPAFTEMMKKLASPEIMGKLTTVFEYLANVISDVAISSITSFSNIIDGFAKDGLKGGLLSILSEIKGFFSNAVTFWDKNGPAIMAAVKDTFNTLKPIFDSIWKEIKPIFVDLLDGMWVAFKEWFFGKNAETLAKEGQDRKNAKVASKVEEAKYRDQASYELGPNASKIAIDKRGRELREQAEMNPIGRATGSLGSTGKLFENWGAGTDVTLHGNEAVVTPAQMGGIINNSLAGELQTLNRQVAELLKYNKETAEYARRNVDATNSLSGNLFA